MFISLFYILPRSSLWGSIFQTHWHCISGYIADHLSVLDSRSFIFHHIIVNTPLSSFIHLFDNNSSPYAAYGSFTVAEMITDKLIYWYHSELDLVLDNYINFSSFLILSKIKSFSHVLT